MPPDARTRSRPDAARPDPAAPDPDPTPNPTARVLGFWLLRLAVVTALALALAAWQGASPWLWAALLAYAAASLLSSLMLERARRRRIAALRDAAPDPRETDPT